MTASDPRRILVFRRGHIGDTLVALPAFWALRERFPQARLTLLCDRPTGAHNTADVAMGTGIFAASIEYPTGGGDASPSRWRMAALALRLRARGFDAAAYLAPSLRTPAQVARDLRFFRWAGIPLVLGAGFPDPPPPPPPGEPLPVEMHEADRLLARLARDGVPVPSPGSGRMDLGLREAERAAATALLRERGVPADKPVIVVAPGSRMPAKVWPEECYRDTVAALIASHDVWPTVIGGPEERPLAERLLAHWGRGSYLSGLGLRAEAAAMAGFRLYLGNDTGSMHLAVCAGLPCVALFSARDAPGKWFPYGAGHAVLRRQVSCEGCQLSVCVAEGMRCLLAIPVDEAVAACRGILDRSAR